MKYVIIRCEDRVRHSADVVSLLEGAKVAHLHQLAQAGAAGLIRHRGSGLDWFQLHRALFGLQASDPIASPGWCYAAHTKVEPGSQETAWCCELVTQQDGVLRDSTAGHIPTKESQELIRTLNEELGSETRRWEVGHDSHHVLMTSEPALQTATSLADQGPDLLIGQPWKRSLAQHPLREPLERLIEQAAVVLERHPVNRVRLDLGENPANLLWLWGAAPRHTESTFSKRVGLSGGLFSSSFPMRGFAACLGVDWRAGLSSFSEPAFQQLFQGVTTLLKQRDWVYVHLRVDSHDPVERLCAMERMDQLLLKPLTDVLPRQGQWRLLTVLDDRPSQSALWVGIGSGLPQRSIERVTYERIAEGSLVVEDGYDVFSWLTQ